MTVIRTGADAGVRNPLVMPSDKELRCLAGIVYAKFPKLDPRKDRDYREADHDRAFRSVYWAVGWMGRGPLDASRAPSWWSDYAHNILADHGIELEVGQRLLAAVVLAHGDVDHGITPEYPIDCRFGLRWVHSGTPASDGWRRVLATGALRPAMAVPYQREHQSPGRVITSNADYHATPVGFLRSENW